MQELDLEKNLLKEIKGLAMLLSRFKPADWNKFLDVVIKWYEQLKADRRIPIPIRYSQLIYLFIIIWMKQEKPYFSKLRKMTTPHHLNYYSDPI